MQPEHQSRKLKHKRFCISRIIPFDCRTRAILPLLPIFSEPCTFGSMAGGARPITKIGIDAKNTKTKLDEDQRQNTGLEQIGKKSSGRYLRKNRKVNEDFEETKKLFLKLPNPPLYSHELHSYAKRLKVHHFRGDFMHDVLSQKSEARAKESGVINLGYKSISICEDE